MRAAAGAIAALVLSLPCAAGDRPALRWGADATGGAPYIFRAPSDPNRIIGFEVEIAELLAQELGMRAEFVQNQWDSLIPGLQRGNYDVVINGIEITEDRRAEVGFSIPYLVSHETLTVRKDEDGIRTPADLKGRSAGTLKACLAERLLQAIPGVRVVGYDTQTTLYDDLANGRIDAVLLDQPAAQYYGTLDPRLKNLPGEFGEFSYGISVRKQEAELLGRIDAALERLIEGGRLREIYERWGLWNPVMARAFRDPSPSRTRPVELEAYLRSRGVRLGWKERLSRYWSYVPLLAQGALTTVELSFLSMVFAVALGLVVALTRLYGSGPLRLAAGAYVELTRGTPLLIQLFFIYYGLPNIGVKLDPFTAAVLGLALNYGAYEAEVYRAGILAVPHSHMEAAFALGMSRLQALRHVVIPQALRVAVPPMTNDFISLLKDSSLVSVITMVELTRVYGQLAATSYDYFGIGLLTAAAYFLIGLPFVRLSRWAEARLAKGRPGRREAAAIAAAPA